ncbi:hypothetical protein ABEX29_05220 [Brevibacillus porteri]|uniref:hypothetical protein n=1 Tax=Brevibacillus porteri TaxID=2126350 RepID=UPI003D1F7953
MLANRFSAIPFLLLLFLVLSFPIPTLAKESSFQNPYYVFIWDEAGNVRITDLAKNEILSSIQYQAEYGTIYNAMTPSLPKGANQITLDQSPAFQPGAIIEIRSESFGGILYHAPNVSSLELNATQKQLIVILDHMNDHRYVQICTARLNESSRKNPPCFRISCKR